MTNQLNQLAVSKDFGRNSRDERKLDTHKALLDPIFQYIDSENEEQITCFQLSDWLNQMGLEMTPQMIFEHICVVRKYRVSAKSQSMVFEKPKIEDVFIDQQDFEEFMSDRGVSTKQAAEIKVDFDNYIKAENYISRSLQRAHRDIEIARLSASKIGDWHKQIEHLYEKPYTQLSKDKIVMKELYFEMKKHKLISDDEIALYRQFFGPGDKEMQELPFNSYLKDLDKRDIV